MVKLGFIGEGSNEKAILSSVSFRDLLHRLELEFVEEVFNAKGGGNLLPKYIEEQVENHYLAGATHIVILTDLEDAPCITSVKTRIGLQQNHLIIIAVSAIEAWFLADTDAISKFIGHNFYCEAPESILNPFQFIKQEKLRLTGRGVDKKRLLCSRMLLNGFSLEAAAAHPNCPSSKYFLDKLKSLATNN